MQSYKILFVLSASLLALAFATPITSDLDLVKVLVQSLAGEDLKEEALDQAAASEVNQQQIPVSEAVFQQIPVSEAVFQQNPVSEEAVEQENAVEQAFSLNCTYVIVISLQLRICGTLCS